MDSKSLESTFTRRLNVPRNSGNESTTVRSGDDLLKQYNATDNQLTEQNKFIAELSPQERANLTKAWVNDVTTRAEKAEMDSVRRELGNSPDGLKKMFTKSLNVLLNEVKPAAADVASAEGRAPERNRPARGALDAHELTHDVIAVDLRRGITAGTSGVGLPEGIAREAAERLDRKSLKES
jgi:hypothetical protein